MTLTLANQTFLVGKFSPIALHLLQVYVCPVQFCVRIFKVFQYNLPTLSRSICFLHLKLNLEVIIIQKLVMIIWSSLVSKV
jgi:hypothetical protein